MHCAGREATSVCSSHTWISNWWLCRSRSTVHPKSSAAQEGLTMLAHHSLCVCVCVLSDSRDDHLEVYVFQGHICSVNELLDPMYSYLWIRPQVSRQQLEKVTSEAANIITAVIQWVSYLYICRLTYCALVTSVFVGKNTNVSRCVCVRFVGGQRSLASTEMLNSELKLMSNKLKKTKHSNLMRVLRLALSAQQVTHTYTQICFTILVGTIHSISHTSTIGPEKGMTGPEAFSSVPFGLDHASPGLTWGKHNLMENGKVFVVCIKQLSCFACSRYGEQLFLAFAAGSVNKDIFRNNKGQLSDPRRVWDKNI